MPLGLIMPHITASQAGSLNRCATLDMLAISELTQRVIDQSDDGYNVIVGSTASNLILFPTLPDGLPDYSHHPGIFEEAEDSTAAGRYQTLKRNGVYYQAFLHLPDFGPVSQDLIALQQIRECGDALALIDQGNLKQALPLFAHLWASIPGSNWGQHEQTITNLLAWYSAAGGLFA